MTTPAPHEPEPVPSSGAPAPSPPARGSRLAAIQRINEDAIVVARAEAQEARRRNERRWAIGIVGGLIVAGFSILLVARLDPFRRPPAPFQGKLPAPGTAAPAVANPPVPGPYAAPPAAPTVVANPVLDSSEDTTLAGLKSPDAGARAEAARALDRWARASMRSNPGSTFPRAAVAALAVAAHDPSPEVREAALVAIGGFMPTTEGLAALRGALDDDKKAVRTAAAISLLRVGEGEVAVARLVEAWDDSSRDFGSKAAAANFDLVGTTRGSYRAFNQEDRSGPVVRCLVAALKDKDRAIRRAAALALAQIGRFEIMADRVSPALVRALRSRDPELRQQAAATLRGLGAEAADAIDGLREARKDTEPDVRRLATEVLSQIEAASRASESP